VGRHPTLRPATLFAAVCLAAGARCGPTPARPDLVLVTVDTLRADRLACYGGPADVGTALCALAARGTRFVWALSSAPSTAPSIASLLTSSHPRDHRVVQRGHSALAPELETLPELLQRSGYTTAAFVANPVLRRTRGFDQGFEVYDDQMLRRERNRRGSIGREAGELTDSALRWLETARSPFFLWIHYQDPHGPYDPPGGAVATDGEGASPLEVLPHNSGWRGLPRYQVLDGARAPETYERRYLEEIRWLDRHLAGLLDVLEARDPRPAIMIGADHGEALGEDEFYFAHGHSVALDQIRVPLVWRPARGGRPGTVVAQPVGNVDIAPTLLEAAGIEAPPAFRGVALPTRARSATSARALLAEHPLRVAIVAGPIALMRDRRALDRPVTNPDSGGLVPPLPPRIAELRATGTAEIRDDPAAREVLERRLAALLAEPEGAPAPTTAEVDDETRDALRALGYLD
jgi:arylsulfatase A-like enzyme